MLDIDKQYVFNEQGEAGSSRCAEGNAVQIPVEQFQEIERLLSQQNNRASEEPESQQPEADIEYVNGFPVIKSYGGTIPASIVDDPCRIST